MAGRYILHVGMKFPYNGRGTPKTLFTMQDAISRSKSGGITEIKVRCDFETGRVFRKGILLLDGVNDVK